MIERVANRLRSDTVNNGWRVACQQMTGADLKGWVNTYRALGWKAVGNLSRWSHQATPSGCRCVFTYPSISLLQGKTVLMLSPPDVFLGWGAAQISGPCAHPTKE